MRKLICGLALAVYLGTSAIVPPAYARADSADDQFLAAVAAMGIDAPRDVLISFAHQMCDAGLTPFASVGPMYGFTAATGLPMQKAFFVAQAGYRSYCSAIAIPVMPWMTPPS